MIIGNDSIHIVTELNHELNRKTLELANHKLRKEFTRMVPWMSLVCLTDSPVNDTSIFSHTYESGSFLHRPEQLKPVAEFLRGDGKPIMIAAVAEETGLADAYQLVSSDPAVGSEEVHYIEVPDELGAARQKRADNFYKAKEMVLKSGTFFSAIFPSLVHFAVPLNAPDEFNFSTHLARGVLFLSPTSPVYPEITMAIALAHEMGHQALMVFQSIEPLLSSPLDQPVWSATRHTLRPAVHALQGAAALAYMVFFVRLLMQSHQFDPAQQVHVQETCSNLTEGLAATLSGLRDHCTFTALGKQIMSDFEQVLAERL
jgi:HEXXH motif-containing protein